MDHSLEDQEAGGVGENELWAWCTCETSNWCWVYRFEPRSGTHTWVPPDTDTESASLLQPHGKCDQKRSTFSYSQNNISEGVWRRINIYREPTLCQGLNQVFILQKSSKRYAILPPFTDEEIEVQKGEVMYPSSQLVSCFKKSKFWLTKHPQSTDHILWVLVSPDSTMSNSQSPSFGQLSFQVVPLLMNFLWYSPNGSFLSISVSVDLLFLNISFKWDYRRWSFAILFSANVMNKK